VSEYLHGATLEEHRRTEKVRGRRTTTICRWLSEVPLRATDDALAVTWVAIEIQNAAGKRTYYNSFVTDLDVNPGNVAELPACGRARWKIENGKFNVLETNGYNLEHNFGHGKETLASVLVVEFTRSGFHVFLLPRTPRSAWALTPQVLRLLLSLHSRSSRTMVAVTAQGT
jgi:hypothetical protein